MTNNEIKQMCLSLLYAEEEKEVIGILRDKGYWDKQEYWRYYGDKEDNFSTIGNQQSRPEAALVEKVVNSVDAILMNECWLSGISPEDDKGPKSIHEAVALFFMGDGKKHETYGHIGYWGTQKRTEVSRRITVSATGSRENPCFTISDAGEGQTPNSMPSTLLDLSHKNKLRIQFVQGKFNMGGTGVLQFCGRQNLQLIISKRNPNIIKDGSFDESNDFWGFTLVRRENPALGRRSSVYTYLAPIGVDHRPGKGDVLCFESETFPIFPDARNPYGREAKWGTSIKLYEYAATGFRTNMMMRDGLLSRLDILLPEIALPIRLHECRDYRGHAGSFETTLSGISVRLEDNKAENLEEGFPTTCSLMAGGEKMTAKIYAFKKGRAETYRKNEGIIFTVNGQTHGHLPISFFSRNRVGMGRLDDSILVSVDCSNLSGRAREDLFMNSRDRLRNGDLREEIEHELEIIIRDHQGLRELRERRKREEIESKVGDSKPLEDALESILKSSPSLSSLFLPGSRLANPFKTKEVIDGGDKYQGKPHPTYFKFAKYPYGYVLERTGAINLRSRITFETDVVNDYFDRLENKGNFTLEIMQKGDTIQVCGYNLNLQNGIGTLNLRLPETCSVGDIFEYEATVSDETLLEPFKNRFIIRVRPAQKIEPGEGERKKPPSSDDGDKREKPVGISLPEINEVFERDWEKRKHKFDKYSALEIVQEGAAIDDDTENGHNPVYSFWINMDNIYFKTELKASKIDTEILNARYIYSLVLIGMALIQEDIKTEKIKEKAKEQSEEDEMPTLEDKIFYTTSAISPILLPMIDSLGSITEEKIVKGGQVGDDE